MVLRLLDLLSKVVQLLLISLNLDIELTHGHPVMLVLVHYLITLYLDRILVLFHLSHLIL